MLRDIKILHLEPTNVCQAACPLCVRETNPLFDKSQQHHLSMDMVLQHFNAARIAKLDKMFMCGNYGDPAAAIYTLDLFKKFRNLNHNIVLGMNTNGSIRATDWWHELAGIINRPKDYVVFSIDGLRDTNHIYRVNTIWDKLIENVTAFISNGGNAHWDMLVYKHNQHQVVECEQLAKKLGFKWFRAKVSKRPLAANLEYPINWDVPAASNGPINCHALLEKSAYIDARGNLLPCCWLGSQLDSVNFEHVQQSWTSDSPNTICKETCSTILGTTAFSQQWQRDIEL